jgi:uncharacterized protein (DUF305 family)
MLKAITLATVVLATPALGQTPMPHAMPMPAPATTPAAPAQTPASKAFQAAMDRMMADMGQRFSGDVDHDFVAGMIPHHRGAVEMAQVELQYGRDPVLKRLAREIIRAQEKEVAFMQRWQREHPLDKQAP